MKQVTQIVFALMVAWGIAACDQGGGSTEAPAPAATTEEPAAETQETIEAVEDADAAADAAQAADEAAADEADEEMSEAAADPITD